MELTQEMAGGAPSVRAAIAKRYRKSLLRNGLRMVSGAGLDETSTTTDLSTPAG